MTLWLATWLAYGQPARVLDREVTLTSRTFAEAQRLGVDLTLHALLTTAAAACPRDAVATIRASGVVDVVAEDRGGAVAMAVGAQAGLRVVAASGIEAAERKAAAMEAMQKAALDMEAVRTSGAPDAARLAALDDARARFTEANTALAAGLGPLRSFQTLSQAVTVAATHDVRDVFLLIGAAHWPDLPHALQTADRYGSDAFVGLRIVRYACPDGV